MKIPYTLIGIILGFLAIFVIPLVASIANHDDSNDMSIAKCRSLGGFPNNDGWGNYTCYIDGELVQ